MDINNNDNTQISHNDKDLSEDIPLDKNINDKKANSKKLFSKGKRVRKHTIKKRDFLLELIKSLFLFIYKTGEKVEKCVSYANREGILRIFDYISTVSIYIFKLSRKYLLKLFGFIKSSSRFWVPSCAILLVAFFVASSTTFALALKVSVDNEVVGYVSEQKDFESAKEKVETDIANKVGDGFSFDRIPVFSFSIVKKADLSDTDKVYDTLYKKAQESLGQTYGIFVEGQLIGAYPKEGQILDLLEELKKPYQTNAKDETIEFIKKIEIVRSMYSRADLLTLEELRNLFTAPKDGATHTVAKGDTVESIAKKYRITATQLRIINKDKDLSSLQKGQILKVSTPAIDLGFKVMRTISYTENIPYETIKTNTTDLFEGSVKVKVAGSSGINDIKAKITLIDGAEKKREIVEKKTTKQPTAQQLLVGTKKISPSGKFIWPVPSSHKVSSSFGYRGREFHPAIDIPAPTGTPIVATDAGTVIFSGWGIGKEIVIDHGNGVTSKYAHCSRLDVSVGQKVYQGQVIGAVGSTGRSTGPHLHFEITNPQGAVVNPLKYVG